MREEHCLVPAEQQQHLSTPTAPSGSEYAEIQVSQWTPDQ